MNEKKKTLDIGDLCPNCGDDHLIRYIRYKKDTRLLLCPKCWFKYTYKGERVKKVLTEKQKGWAHPR